MLIKYLLFSDYFEERRLKNLLKKETPTPTPMEGSSFRRAWLRGISHTHKRYF